MLQAVLIFLIGVLLLGALGKWRRPRVPPGKTGTSVEAARKCATCGVYVFGSRQEPCTRPDCPQR